MENERKPGKVGISVVVNTLVSFLNVLQYCLWEDSILSTLTNVLEVWEDFSQKS